MVDCHHMNDETVVVVVDDEKMHDTIVPPLLSHGESS